MGFVLGGIGLLLLVIGLAKSAGGGGIVTRTPAGGPPVGPDGLPDLAAPEMPPGAPAPVPAPPAATARATQHHVERAVSEVLQEAAQHPEQPPATLTPMGPPVPHPSRIEAGPVPTPGVTPSGEHAPGPVPGASTALPGYNTDEAHRLAAPLAQHITSRRNRYDHQKVRAFQTAAGIPADGIYGPNTRVALAHYGVRNPPPAMRT